jgi:hypothetical protein
VRDPIQGHPRENAGQAQAVIPVEMGDTDAGDPGRGDPGEQHPPLCPLTRVKQQSLAIPKQQVAVVVAAAGRRLARRAKNHQFPVRHSTRPYARHTDGTGPAAAEFRRVAWEGPGWSAGIREINAPAGWRSR